MSITPQDIQTKQFHVRFRGFDVEEVDSFLERLAEEFLILSQENKQLKDRLESMTKTIEQHKEQERKFQDAILSAHAIADEMKERSRQEADRMVEEARSSVQNLQDKAHEEITSLESTIVNLKDLKDRVHDDVRGLLESYLEKLEEVAQGVALDYQPDSRQALPESHTEPSPADEAMAVEEPEPTVSFDEPAPEEAPLAADIDTEAFFEPDGPRVEVAGEEDEEEAIPDLDGEMLFNLNDPLDQLESDLTGKGPHSKE